MFRSERQWNRVLLATLLIALFARVAQSADQPTLFAKPGRMIDVGHGSRLSLYCVGAGSPTIVLETGFGGGTAATWGILQAKLGKVTHTCSYDRAGYGFSTLGENLPRDLNHMVADLSTLLKKSGERPPYLLAGHSNGGFIISSYAKLYPDRVAGLIFFDAALALPEDIQDQSQSKIAPLDPILQKHLTQIRRCLERAEAGLTPKPGDKCVDPDSYSSLPADLARAELASLVKPDYWRAYLSEAENNYSDVSSGQARSLLPHRWERLPVRVFTASVGAMSDEQAAKAFGLSTTDHVGLEQTRKGRARWEERQASICSLARDCKAVRVRTANHLVQNEVPDQVVETVSELVVRIREHQ